MTAIHYGDITIVSLRDHKADDVAPKEEHNAALKFLHDKTISHIETFEYMGKTCIERIQFTDGFTLELSGSCDNCNVDYAEDASGVRFYPDGADE
jgi:hypothetical protein